MTESPPSNNTQGTRARGVWSIMEENIKENKDKEKERRIKREVAKLKRNWTKKGQKPDELTKKLLEFCMPIIQNVAFMTITLEDLKDRKSVV